MKSLEEVSKIVGMSRRTIQEYERAGVISKPSHRTKRGYLRYDNQDISRLFQVRFYRELGDEVKDILEIFKAPDYNRKNAITGQLLEMRKKKERLEDLITIAELIRDHDLSPEELTGTVLQAHEVPFDVILSAFSGGIRAAETCASNGQDLEEEAVEECFEVVEKIPELLRWGYGPESQVIQEKVEAAHQALTGNLFPSVFFFWSLWQMLSPGTELGTMLDDLYGAGTAETLYQSVHFYTERKLKTIVTPGIRKAIRKIEQLHAAREHPEGEAVQQCIQELLTVLHRQTGLDERSWAELNPVLKRQAFESWELPPDQKEQLEFLVQAVEYFYRKKDTKCIQQPTAEPLSDPE